MHLKIFKPTSSRIDTAKSPRVSLLSKHENHAIPALQEKLVNIFSNSSERYVITIKKNIGSASHQESTLANEFDNNFTLKYWILFN